MRLVEADGEAVPGASMPDWPSAEPPFGSRTQPPSTAAASAAALPAAPQDVTIPLRYACPVISPQTQGLLDTRTLLMTCGACA